MPAVLEVTDLCKKYATGGADAVEALRGVSFSVEAGEFIAVMGPSGSGKSTLLHLIGGLLPPTSGTILIEGQNLGGKGDRERTLFRRRRLGIIFQGHNLLPTLTAAENVALPLMFDGAGLADIEPKAAELLRTVDLLHRGGHRPQAMSGGEQQRVAVARALVNDPAIVLADEPTGNLDTHHGAEIWALLRRLADEHGRTIVAVTHELAGAARADRVLVLRDGGIVGEFHPGKDADASLVASRYAELVL